MDDGLLADPATGLPLMPVMDMVIFGMPIPGNEGGIDRLGNTVPLGTATLNVVLNNNAIDLGVLVGDFSVPPGLFSLGTVGSNTATPLGLAGGAAGPALTLTLGAVDAFIQADEAEFQLRGF